MEDEVDEVVENIKKIFPQLRESEIRDVYLMMGKDFGSTIETLLQKADNEE